MYRTCAWCSAREVAHVDTRGKLGKVDGRYPHWVGPYTGTRFSVSLRCAGLCDPVGPWFACAPCAPVVDVEGGFPHLALM